ncbi:MAG: PTS sugar transporter subunit IIA, partial [Proteobacteria bacterium]|nr:PTS sugar transporter subunit IIA [Pseudomonadota bacterium]
VGDSAHLRERSRVIIDNFVSFIFAPIFFAGIGLKVNFMTHFDLSLVVVITLVACICKFSGAMIGARWGKMAVQEASAVGSAMVSVGTMGIIVGMIALEAGIIQQTLFVALIVMAIVTSMISGPLMRMVLRTEKKQELQALLSQKLFFQPLEASSCRGVIQEMATAVCAIKALDLKTVSQAVHAREDALSTGIGNGVALPHARIEGLQSSVVAVGISEKGIDFDAPDGKPAHVIFLILTPADDPRGQLEIVSRIARLFSSPQMAERARENTNFTDFLALVQTGTGV